MEFVNKFHFSWNLSFFACLLQGEEELLWLMILARGKKEDK